MRAMQYFRDRQCQLQSVTHVMKYAKYCSETGRCCLFVPWRYQRCHYSYMFVLRLLNSIGVSYYTERKKKEKISVCIENRLYIKIM